MMLTKEVNTQGWLYKTVSWFCKLFDGEAPETSCGYLIKGIVTGYFLFIMPVVAALEFIGLPFYEVGLFAGCTAAFGMVLSFMLGVVVCAMLVLCVMAAIILLLVFGLKPFKDLKGHHQPLAWTMPILKLYDWVCTFKGKYCKPLNKTDQG